jgi:ubiquitin-conjugating enzyme E2 Q
MVELADKIPAHVLMSWDNQFLLPRQHLVLVIAGLWGVYPPVQSDGTLSPAAIQSCTSLKFYVGLSRQYKPSKKHVIASLRRYGLQSDQQNGVEDGVVEEYTNVDEKSKVGPAEDDGTFDKFSLSSSLESLLDEHFLPLLRVRRQFKLGWAAAEELHWRSQELQRSHEVLLKEMQEVCFRSTKVIVIYSSLFHFY